MAFTSPSKVLHSNYPNQPPHEWHPHHGVSHRQQQQQRSIPKTIVTRSSTRSGSSSRRDSLNCPSPFSAGGSPRSGSSSRRDSLNCPSPFSAGGSPRSPVKSRNQAAPGKQQYPETAVTAEVDFVKLKDFQTKLDKILSNKETFLKSSSSSFKQFDKDESGTLEFGEVKKLIQKLINNLQLPPVDETILIKIFKRYDMHNVNSLQLHEFQSMYWELLHTIKERYYPTRKVRVKRSAFVGQRILAGDQSIENMFIFNKRLGAGSFGEVFSVTEKSSGFERVCKIINKDLSKIPMEQIAAEIDVCKKLDHPNIIKIFEVYSDYNSIYIIMETCSGGELADRISKTFEQGFILTEQYVANIMKQLLAAVNYFHGIKVAHKDLKPENILYQSKASDSPIKVIDFGLAEMFDRKTEFSQNAAGTYLYMAPEVLDYIVTLKCDIWSCGCIMFQLFTGDVPHSGATLEEVEYKLRHCEPDYTKFSGLPISEAAVNLLKHMLCRDLNKRYSAQQCLEHPWMKRVQYSNIELPQEICANLKRYRRQSNLKNALTNMLAHQLNVTGSQVRLINDVFKALDVDSNGSLSKMELADGLKRVGFPPHEITQIVHALDVDASDTIAYTEFLAACYSWRESELNIVWTAFSKMDRNGDGRITVDEFVKCLCGSEDGDNKNALRTRIVRDEKELKKMVCEIDKNGDGIIDWDEFLSFMRD